MKRVESNDDYPRTGRQAMKYRNFTEQGFELLLPAASISRGGGITYPPLR